MHTDNERRLTDALGVTRSVTFDGSTYDYTVPIKWGTGDYADSYPVIVLTYTQQAAQRDDDQPINDLESIDTLPGQQKVDINNVARVLDMIEVTVAADENRDDNGVPGHVKCGQIAMDLWTQLRFELDLNEDGPNGERPLLFRIAGSTGGPEPPTGPMNEDSIVRSRFTVQVNYSIVHTETVDSVDEAEYTTDIDN